MSLHGNFVNLVGFEPTSSIWVWHWEKHLYCPAMPKLVRVIPFWYGQPSIHQQYAINITLLHTTF
jgi:hypothetical protein